MEKPKYTKKEKELIKAFGGCMRCWGKGYGTSIEFASSRRSNVQLPMMRFCTCPRGHQLKTIIEQMED